MSCLSRHSPRAAVLAVVAVAGLLAGCGGDRILAPDLSATAAPVGTVRWADPGAGVSLTVPANWPIATDRAPMLATFSSGAAVMALWRYDRSAPTPGSPAELRAALSALEATARRADPGLTIIAAETSRLDGAGVVILDAVERTGGRSRRVRSEHVYLPGGEVVLEASAPSPVFHLLDRAVFSPVRHSLALLDGGRPRAGQITTTPTTPRP